MMRHFAGFALAMGLVAVAGQGAARADGHPADFTVHNGTGGAITALYVSDANDDKWGGDILGRDVLNDGESAKVTFKGDESVCKFDIKIDEKDGKSWVIPGINLCEINDLGFAMQGGKVVYVKE
jgi:hypothetical protein